LAIDNQNEGVNYIEARFAPQLLIDPAKGLTMESVIEACNRGFLKAKNEYNSKAEVISGAKPEFDYGIITCAMRKFASNFSPYYANFFNMMEYSRETEVIKEAALQLVKASVKIRNEKGIPIVGVDLAGQEEGYPANHFKEAYDFAHKNFMNKTVHAGEAYGAESIFQAITDLHADRIGHGYYLFDPDKISDPSIVNRVKYISDLSSFVADKRVVIEVCITSNLQTNPDIKLAKNHNFKKMLESRMALTICTDNRLVSNTTVSNEYRVIFDNFDVPLKQLKDIVAYGFKKSFHPGSYVDKRNYAKKCMQYFDRVAQKHGVL